MAKRHRWTVEKPLSAKRGEEEKEPAFISLPEICKRSKQRIRTKT